MSWRIWRWARRGQRRQHRRVYQDLDQNAFFENMQLEDRFDEAIGEHRFKAYYQPKCNPKRAKSSAARRWFCWVQEDGTMLSPARFYPAV